MQKKSKTKISKFALSITTKKRGMIPILLSNTLNTHAHTVAWQAVDGGAPAPIATPTTLGTQIVAGRDRVPLAQRAGLALG